MYSTLYSLLKELSTCSKLEQFNLLETAHYHEDKHVLTRDSPFYIINWKAYKLFKVVYYLSCCTDITDVSILGNVHTLDLSC
jgi:hypothetical protein